MISTEYDRKISQCAWCRCLMIKGIKIKDSDELFNLSHGICSSCKKDKFDLPVNKMEEVFLNKRNVK